MSYLIGGFCLSDFSSYIAAPANLEGDRRIFHVDINT